jgi:hypothetical protein
LVHSAKAPVWVVEVRPELTAWLTPGKGWRILGMSAWTQFSALLFLAAGQRFIASGARGAPPHAAFAQSSDPAALGRHYPLPPFAVNDPGRIFG